MRYNATNRPATILVWLSGALGDSLLGIPALRALRSWAPPACITVVGRAHYLEFAAKLGLADRVEESDGPFGTGLFTGTLPEVAKPIDLAVIWSSAWPELKERLLRLGAESVLAAPPRGNDRRHQAHYLLDCLAPLGVATRLRLPAWRPARGQAGARLAHSSDPSRYLVLLHAGAGAPWKRWPLAHFLALAVMLRSAGMTVRWTCGPADPDIRAGLVDAGLASELLDMPSLEELAGAITLGSLVVSADTGVAHLAALCRTATLTIFGPTDPQRWHPLGGRARIVQAELLCRGDWAPVPSTAGVSELALRRCLGAPDGECSCLATLTPEAVLSKCLELAGIWRI